MRALRYRSRVMAVALAAGMAAPVPLSDAAATLGGVGSGGPRGSGFLIVENAGQWDPARDCSGSGCPPSGKSDDTWLWDGSTWTETAKAGGRLMGDQHSP